MSQWTAVALGAVAGATIFLGLPVARMRGLPKPVQGFLNAFATGILVFLLWDILTHAAGPVEVAIKQGNGGPFAAMAVIFAGGIGVGPTFLGTWIGYLANSNYFSIAFLAVAAGALLYVLNELFNLGRRISTPQTFAWGLLAGFLTAYATDLFLTVASGA